MRSSSQQIVSYCLGLRTQNPGLREVDLEPSPKRDSDKIKIWIWSVMLMIIFRKQPHQKLMWLLKNLNTALTVFPHGFKKVE